MQLTAPGTVRQLLNAHGIRIKKRLGQNFLVDRNILQKIVAAAELEADDTVLEVGPGLGALTQALAERAGRVVAVEIDEQLIPVLRKTLAAYPNVTIVHADALRLDLGSLVPGAAKVKVVANLPYYITSPLLMHFLEADLPLERLVVMVQAEVAERLQAAPGSKAYGALTVAVQYRAEVTRVAKVPRTVFLPQPGVDSAILCLRLRPYPVRPKDEGLFFAVVRAAFAQRRKTLRNALAPLAGERGVAVEEVLGKANVDPAVRGETLSIEAFIAVADALAEVSE